MGLFLAQENPLVSNPPTSILYRAAAVCDAVGTEGRPGAVAVRDGRVVAAGPVGWAERQIDQPDRIIDLPDMLLLPTMVNAHAHLDLTSLGPRPFPGDFVSWLRMVIDDAPRDESLVSEAVREGSRLSRESGVGYVGDIARCVASVQARLIDKTLSGASYLECFGIGAGKRDGIRNLRTQIDQLLSGISTPEDGFVGWNASGDGLRIGIQPHAPYSAGSDLYEAAVETGRRFGLSLSTHLAESIEELIFVDQAKGPLARLVRDLEKWDESIRPTGLTPLEWMREKLERGRWLLAHCNFLQDKDIEILAKTDASVVYCPIASDYFQHGLAAQSAGWRWDYSGKQSDRREDSHSMWQHRYIDLLDTGVNVCLGTDSIVCQPKEESQPLSILSQMRYLYRRDKTDPTALLAMATTNGMAALGFDPRDATLQPGSMAGVASVAIDAADTADPMRQILTNDAPLRCVDRSDVSQDF